jgi:5'-nucleotidase
MKRKLLVLLTLCWSVTLFAEKKEVHILSANDMHAAIEAFPQLAAIADSLRALYPSLLVFSAGDNRTGDPLNDRYEIPAYPMVALMNQVGFNASTLGNHEFDSHQDGMAKLISLSNFRHICANIQPDPEWGIHCIPYQIFDVEGVKVGVVGVVQLGTRGIPDSHPDNVKGISFSPVKETVQKYAWLREKCDVTILLTHIGYEDDVELSKDVPWVDLIIGGHTHTQLKGDEVVNGVLITQNKNKFGRVTYTTITLEDGKIVERKAEYIDIKKYPKKNPLVKAMVEHFGDDPKFKRVLATAETPFEAREELGCMMCDAFMNETESDIAIENPGGVRLESHPAGEITVRDVLEMDPFDNNAVILELTGEEILRMITTYCNNILVSFPYVGGMKCELTLDRTNPSRIKSVQLLTPNGKKLNMKRKYRVVTNNYITVTSKIPEGAAQTLNVQTTDLIMQYLEKKKWVDYRGVRRLEIINK